MHLFQQVVVKILSRVLSAGIREKQLLARQKKKETDLRGCGNGADVSVFPNRVSKVGVEQNYVLSKTRPWPGAKNPLIAPTCCTARVSDSEKPKHNAGVARCLRIPLRLPNIGNLAVTVACNSRFWHPPGIDKNI